MGGGQGSSGTTGTGGDLGGLLSGLMGSGADTSGNTGTTLSPNQSPNADDSGLGGLLGDVRRQQGQPGITTPRTANDRRRVNARSPVVFIRLSTYSGFFASANSTGVVVLIPSGPNSDFTSSSWLRLNAATCSGVI